MNPPKRGTRKTGWFAATAAATTLSWAILGLLWAQVILLPEPLLLPPPSWAELLGRIPATPRPERFVVMLLKETSLLFGLTVGCYGIRAVSFTAFRDGFGSASGIGGPRRQLSEQTRPQVHRQQKRDHQQRPPCSLQHQLRRP
jgi:hypothetical protein